MRCDMSERKMATVRKIVEINPIPDADAIEVAVVDGWKVVVKKGEFVVNDIVVYCEIDSWIPFDLAPFLSKGKEPKEYNGIKGERLRTVKLRGQISQGLILPFGVIMSNCEGEAVSTDWNFGDDVSEILNIQKYEPPVPSQLYGLIRGNFPSFVPKTDQERIQNLKKELQQYIDKKYTFEVTEKLDGSSCTMYMKDGEFGVCSRNLDLKYDENNTFWKMAIGYDVQDSLIECYGENVNIAIQGEVIGEGIQGNPYKWIGQKFFVFDIFDINSQKYFSSDDRIAMCEILKLPHVPILNLDYKIPEGFGVDDILELAEDKSDVHINTNREGIVFKCIEDPSISFKSISNSFLLKQK